MKEAGVTWVHWNQQHRIARSGNSSLVAYAPHLERQRLKSSQVNTAADLPGSFLECLTFIHVTSAQRRFMIALSSIIAVAVVAAHIIIIVIINITVVIVTFELCSILVYNPILSDTM